MKRTIAPFALAVSWYFSMINLIHGVSPVLQESKLAMMPRESMHIHTHRHSEFHSQHMPRQPGSSTSGKGPRS